MFSKIGELMNRGESGTFSHVRLFMPGRGRGKKEKVDY